MKAQRLCAVVALAVVGGAGVAGAVAAKNPLTNATVLHTTYYDCNPNNAFHGAVAIGNGTCSMWNLRPMVAGSYYWNVVGTSSNCSSTPQAPANYIYVNASGGYRFAQYHHNHNANSYSRVCDRCALGLVGASGTSIAHVRAENTLNSTKLTAWYSGYVTCGPLADFAIVGYPRL